MHGSQKGRGKDFCSAPPYYYIGARPRLRRPPNSEYNERFLAPSFKGERTAVMFWGAVGYNSHSPLVAVRRRDPSERTSDKDRLGLNS